MRGLESVVVALVGFSTIGCAHDLESVPLPCDDKQSCPQGSVCRNNRCVVGDAGAAREASADGPLADLGQDAPTLDRGADVGGDKALPDAPPDSKAGDAPLVDLPAQDAAKPDLPAPDLPAPDAKIPDAPSPDAPAPDAKVPDAKVPDAAPKPAPTGLCSDDKWCFENPLPHGNGYSNVWAHSPTNVFAVSGGVVTHYDGAKTRVIKSGLKSTLYDVWGTSPTEVFVCGTLGVVLKYDGATWTPLNTGFSGTLYSVWGTSGANLYAVGYSGKVLRYTGLYWNTEKTPTTATADLKSIWGSGPTDIHAVGDKGTALRYDGKDWKETNPPTTSMIHDVWGSGPTNVFIAADHSTGNYLRFNGTSWSTPAPAVSKTKSIYGIWGSGHTNVYAAGVYSFMARYNGTSWSDHTPGAYLHFRGISGSGAKFVALAGDRDGVLLKFVDGKYYGHMHDNVYGFPLWAVWGSGPSDIYAGGDKMLHHDGKSWKVMANSPPHPVYAIWGSDPTTVFAAGTGKDFSRRVGNKWVQVPKGTSNTMYAIWGTSATNVYMVGDSGTMVRIQGTGISAVVPVSSGHKYSAVWGTGPTNVYVVGKGGVIVHFNGAKWTQIKNFTTTTTADLTGIWGSSHSDIFVVGTSVAIHHNGSTWRVDASTFMGCDAQGGVWGSGPTNVFAPCYNGTVRRHRGKVHGGTKQWEIMTAWGKINDIWGNGTTDVWTVGPGGKILHYKP